MIEDRKNGFGSGITDARQTAAEEHPEGHFACLLFLLFQLQKTATQNLVILERIGVCIASKWLDNEIKHSFQLILLNTKC
jgi:hypothetical protein